MSFCFRYNGFPHYSCIIGIVIFCICQVIGRHTTYHFTLTSTMRVGTVWCGRDTERTFLTTSVPEPKSYAGTRPRCMTSVPSNTSWDTTVGLLLDFSFCYFQTVSSMITITYTHSVQTTGENPTLRAIHVKPSAVATISGRGGRIQEVAMTLRSEVASLSALNWDLFLWSCTALFTVYCILIQFKIPKHLEKAALVHLICHLTTLFSCLCDVSYVRLYLGKDSLEAKC